ncbi:hypothetical protein Slin15195_G058730 [Septoria linicola]|uniref:Uncharacterized protein n=1 Tax=Septoria linicola TaxID=215465 RepID=A0A9Q9AQC8_9PEZI|nr:hypothetical protein Slin14017_G074590 [Septoria linicola]USW52554.1 hypothetical protein Slin15195_G058730 [Septoria linicola]
MPMIGYDRPSVSSSPEEELADNDATGPNVELPDEDDFDLPAHSPPDESYGFVSPTLSNSPPWRIENVQHRNGITDGNHPTNGTVIGQHTNGVANGNHTNGVVNGHHTNGVTNGHDQIGGVDHGSDDDSDDDSDEQFQPEDEPVYSVNGAVVCQNRIYTITPRPPTPPPGAPESWATWRHARSRAEDKCQPCIELNRPECLWHLDDEVGNPPCLQCELGDDLCRPAGEP